MNIRDIKPSNNIKPRIKEQTQQRHFPYSLIGHFLFKLNEALSHQTQQRHQRIWPNTFWSLLIHYIQLTKTLSRLKWSSLSSKALSLSDQNLYLYLSFDFLFGSGFRERDNGCWVRLGLLGSRLSLRLWSVIVGGFRERYGGCCVRLGLLGSGLSLRIWSMIVGGFDWVWLDLGLEKEMLVGAGFNWVRWLGLQGLLLLLVWSVIDSRHLGFGVCWRFGFGVCWEFYILKFLFFVF